MTLLSDVLTAAVACLMAVISWLARVMWGRQNRLEKALQDSTQDLHRAIHDQGQILRQEHGKLRDTMTEQNNRIVDILLERHR